MSEKRFTLTDWHEVKDNGKIMTVDEVVGKLNEQQAEIERLQKVIDLTNYQLKVQDRIIQMEENE